MFPKALSASLILCLAVSSLSLAATAPSGGFTWVTIGDVNNPADPLNSGAVPGIGSVSYAYRLSAYEVTNTQYVEFLNAVAESDPHELYSTFMTTIASSGINRSGSDGSYVYTSKPGYENNPVNQVNWYDAARFVNWLHNGKPAGVSAGTENGVYDMSLQSTNPAAITRQAGARYFIPSENEWYKAAYYDPTPGAGGGDNYWLYPTRKDAPPHSDNPNSLDTPDNTNVANIKRDDNLGGTYNAGYAMTQSQHYSISQNYVTDVGAFPFTLNYYGTYDQAGNLMEWLENNSGVNRYVRGGGWVFNNATTWSPYRVAIEPERGDDQGFRIATEIPEPGSTSIILALAAASFLQRGRRLHRS